MLVIEAENVQVKLQKKQKQAGPFLIIARACGVAFDTAHATNPGGPVILYPPHGLLHQLWYLRPAGTEGEFVTVCPASAKASRVDGQGVAGRVPAAAEGTRQRGRQARAAPQWQLPPHRPGVPANVDRAAETSCPTARLAWRLTRVGDPPGHSGLGGHDRIGSARTPRTAEALRYQSRSRDAGRLPGLARDRRRCLRQGRL
jgi:hypothetical protein